MTKRFIAAAALFSLSLSAQAAAYVGSNVIGANSAVWQFFARIWPL